MFCLLCQNKLCLSADKIHKITKLLSFQSCSQNCVSRAVFSWPIFLCIKGDYNESVLAFAPCGTEFILCVPKSKHQLPYWHTALLKWNNHDLERKSLCMCVCLCSSKLRICTKFRLRSQMYDHHVAITSISIKGTAGKPWHLLSYVQINSFGATPR